MEIVTEPDMDCEDDAVALFAYIRSVARYIKTSDANMEKGQLRADVNVSINLKNTKMKMVIQYMAQELKLKILIL